VRPSAIDRLDAGEASVIYCESMAFVKRWLWLAPLGLCGGCGDDLPQCGPGTELGQDAHCHPTESLDPGNFSSPLVLLQRLQGEEDHMHISQVRYRESDERLFYCSYTFGMIDASDPQDMSYLVQGLRHETPSGSPRVPGCLHFMWDDDDPDLVFTSHRGNIDFATFLSGWDLGSAEVDGDVEFTPVQLPALQEPGESYGGLDVENGLVYVALHENGLGIYDYDTTNGFTRVAAATGFENAWTVAVRGTTAYVADGTGGLAVADVSDPADVQILGRAVLGGTAQDIVLEGGLAYVAAGSAGMVIVDVSDPAAPAVVSSVPTYGNAVAVAASAGRAYVADWNDIRVLDVADPAEPVQIAATRITINLDYEVCTGTDDDEVCTPDDSRPDATARNLAVAAHDDVLFAGNWWVPSAFRVHADRLAPYLVLPEDVSLLDFGPTPMGETSTIELPVSNQGTAPLTLYDNWVDSTAFTVTPAELRIEPGQTGTLTLAYTPMASGKETGLLYLRSDDPQQPVRQAFLVGNQPGLGVGQPLPDFDLTLVDGSPFSSSALEGKVALLAYFATF
jgi:hypothetical protein